MSMGDSVPGEQIGQAMSTAGLERIDRERASSGSFFRESAEIPSAYRYGFVAGTAFALFLGWVFFGGKR